jgi:hypothetical protein
MDSPNADYNALMDLKKDTPFSARYDIWMTTLAQQNGINTSVQAKLKEKREFGLQKYGERAFQSNFDNAISSPVGAHLGDELVDTYNYSLHGLWVGYTSGDAKRVEVYQRILSDLNQLMISVAALRELLSPEEAEALAWVGN